MKLTGGILMLLIELQWIVCCAEQTNLSVYGYRQLKYSGDRSGIVFISYKDQNKIAQI